ncbi:MAG: ParB N-terminal domain-containing protein [Candidatus Thorarchaeota archaeon]|jgi:ParB family chromosome partitioning protein
MKIKLDNIKIGARYRKDMGDIQQLAESMKSLGLLQPIVIDQANNLIAGRRRIEAAKLLKWSSIDCHIVDIPALLLGERDENAVRKDFAPSEMVAIKRATIEYETAEAQKRQLAGLKKGDKARMENFSERGQGRAKDKIARAVGTSRPTLDKAEAVVIAAEEEPEKYGDLITIMDEEAQRYAALKLVLV